MGDAEVQRGFEQPRHQIGRRCAAAGAGTRLGREHVRQPIEELPHARRQHLFEACEGERQVALKRCSRHRFEHVPAQIERAQLREREAGLNPFQHLAIEPPVRAPFFVALVVQRETGLL